MTIKEFAQAIFADENFKNTMSALYDRWRDEEGYEDINEYGKMLHKAINKVVPCKYVSATKRPFGVWVNYQGTDVHFNAKLKGCYLMFGANLRKPKK